MKNKNLKTKIFNSKSETSDVRSVVAKSDDGTIQITFTVPYEKITKAKEEALLDIGKDLEVPGFRKGKAPTDKVLNQVSQNTLIEKSLAKILPSCLGKAINEHKIKIVMYPKFELIKAEEGKDWVVRAITCEMPVFDLGDYKEKLKGAGKAKSIWTPTKAKSGNGENEKDHELSQLEKEQEVMRILLENIKIKIPHILIDDEVNSKLAKLLERLEKLGLSLESYLSSIKKTSEQLRSEYLLQSQQGISLDFILNRIAEEEKIKVDQKDIDQAITAASSDPKIADNLNSPEQKQLIESILRKRSALDYLITLL